MLYWIILVTVLSPIIDGTSQTTSSDRLASDSSYAMASSPGQDSAEDKLDKMMVFLHNMQIKQEETVSRSEQKLLKNIHAVATDHDVFKAEVHSEIESLRFLLGQLSLVNHNSFQIGQSHSSTFSPQTNSSTIPAVQSPSISYGPTITNSAVSGLNNLSSDPQTNLMLMMTAFFSKLSTAFTEIKTTDVKTDWPKFDGTKTKFCSWYLTILSQVSVPLWNELYDAVSNDLVLATSNSSLNAKFYSKLLLSLEGEALRSIACVKHLRADGLQLMQEIIQTYCPKSVPEVIAMKTAEFWGTLKRFPYETVDDYYNRFHNLLDDLSDADTVIPIFSAIHHFIFTLGSEFESLQNNYRQGNLSSQWLTQDWPTILVLCRDYFNSVKPLGVSKCETRSEKVSMTPVERAEHQKQVKMCFINPTKYSWEIEAASQKFPFLCLYHLSNSHKTEVCGVLKGGEKSTDGSRTISSSVNQGQFRHITDNVVDDFESDQHDDDASVDITANDTNEDDLSYFARMANHFLRLVKSSPDTTASHHSVQFPIIADSGANNHMFCDLEFFESLSPASGDVILGDGVTRLKIQGVGTVKCQVGDHILSIDGIKYIPDLAESIYSLFHHIKCPGHGLCSSFDSGLDVVFPEFYTKTIIGHNDIYLDAVPMNDFTCSNVTTLCHKLTASDPKKEPTITERENILKLFRDYYKHVKMKRATNLPVPDGFRQSSNHQSLHFHEPSSPLNTDNLELFDDSLSFSPSSIESSGLNVPIIRCVDKPSTSLSNVITYSKDLIWASVGFHRIDSIKICLQELYQNMVKLDSTPADAVLDVGDTSTIRKSPRITTPVPRPPKFGDAIHMDIVFSPDVSIGNIHYALLFTDYFSQMTCLYPLQNLTTDIQKQPEAFFAHIGFYPKCLISDFDTKLIGGKARDYLNT
jgi:hypothetical protein